MSTNELRSPEIQAIKTAPWWEIILVMAVYLIARLLSPGLAQILAVPLILYMIIESWMRHRSWADNGFDPRGILPGLRKTILWALFVITIFQIIPVYGEHLVFPDVSAHILSRVPYDLSTIGPGVFIFLAISTFLEEVIFRALFQNRLRAFTSPVVAILVVSLVFCIGHYQPGPALTVFLDLLGVFIDSVIFGIIFEKSKNVFVSWIPHYLTDIVALFLLLSLK